MLPTYRVRARNTSADSENKIHDDAIAASYGFRGGLVPGITVYAYMTVPLVERFGLDWLERGSMQVRFHKPFYHGDEALVKARVDDEARPLKVSVTAEQVDGIVCATALATVDDPSSWLGEARLPDFPEPPLPALDMRPAASPESLVPGAFLGALIEEFTVPDTASLRDLEERLPIYSGANAVAHPFALLRLSNQILMSNFKLGPWIHAASDVINRDVVRNGETVSVRGRIRECFERKGHEFVVLDVLIGASGGRIVQQVRHTAVYNPRQRS